MFWRIYYRLSLPQHNRALHTAAHRNANHLRIHNVIELLMNPGPTAQSPGEPGKTVPVQAAPPAHLGRQTSIDAQRTIGIPRWRTTGTTMPPSIRVVSFRRCRRVSVVRQQRCCMREFAHSTYVRLSCPPTSANLTAVDTGWCTSAYTEDTHV